MSRLTITKDELKRLAKLGNEIGFNRQLDPDMVIGDGAVRFAFIHRHIDGKQVAAHVRAVTTAGILDMPMDEWSKLSPEPPVDLER